MILVLVVIGRFWWILLGISGTGVELWAEVTIEIV